MKMEKDYHYIQEVLSPDFVGKRVKIRGWVYRQRNSKKMAFIVLRDGTETLQCTGKKDQLSEELFNMLCEVKYESSVIIEGNIKEDNRAPNGYEMQIENFTIIQMAETFPIQKDQSDSFLLDYRHLWVRSQKLTHSFRVKAKLLQGAREYFDQQGYVEMTPPIITGSSCEGGSTLFELNYFGKKAFLSQSAQLYLETLIFAHQNVYSLTPSFRAEKSRTNRHLAEYWHLEAEAAFLDLNGIIKFEDGLVCAMIHKVAQDEPKALKALGRDPQDLLNIEGPFDRIHYDEAIDIINKKGVEIPWGEDFGTHHERALTEDLKSPVHVTHFPRKIKAFYMKTLDGKYAEANDLLAPEGYGELIGSSQREEDINVIIDNLKRDGSKIADYEWYLDLRRYGSVQHSGFGMGIERMMRWVCNLDHIRDTIAYPRVMNRNTP
ncbi:Asparagine--tRNA ligase [Candidatus Lokiarchaeum ossiferum]|uniref:Asparagine--tRNA ligase n=1 Tax=Candidatus Lokiarchaeum ossiferum TaxID=2951803 RepID=A0ABY6I088_9ARCH|nr:Asparagine--tRNA ligase [Candidatus Lokiarchaeum sp. B-35]